MRTTVAHIEARVSSPKGSVLMSDKARSDQVDTISAPSLMMSDAYVPASDETVCVYISCAIYTIAIDDKSDVVV
jgi:hypothetical protein